ncbi:MAG: hypothetical protein HY376_01135, partial [Candidatus Blackburnbacteria bacterium]|nr:hypothetical protein [Candidatus Blackburnbacteria bacterium]
GEQFNNGTLKNRTGVCGGDACPNWTVGRYGGGMKFDGEGDYVDVPFTDALNLTAKITIEAWINWTGQGDSSQGIFSAGLVSWPNQRKWDLIVDNGGGGWVFGRIVWGAGSQQTWDSRASATSITPNSLTHIAITVDNTTSTNNIKFYLNGVLDATRSLPNATGDYWGARSFVIGALRRLTTSDSFFNGTIDEVRVYNRALTQGEIIEDMNSAYPVSRPVASWSFENGTKDTHSIVKGKYGAAMSFDGIDDYLDAGNSANITFAGDFTLGAWVKSTPSWNSNNKYLLHKGRVGMEGYHLRFTDTGSIQAQLCDNVPTCVSVSSANTVSDGSWHHVAAAFDRDDKIYLYVDGRLDAISPAIVSIGAINNSVHGLRIGRQSTGSVNYFDGVIDEIVAYNKALSGDEVLEAMKNPSQLKGSALYINFDDSAPAQTAMPAITPTPAPTPTPNVTATPEQTAAPTPSPNLTLPGTPVATSTPVPSATPTAAPIGSLSCTLSTSVVDKSVSGGACSGNQWCVQIAPSYAGNGTAVINPVYQSWDFGNGSGVNNSNSTTYRGYNRPSGSTATYTVSLTATENNGASGARQATCSKSDVQVPPPGQSLPTPTPGGGGATPTPAPPIPTEPPLPGTGAIRFYNADCTTPYNGEDNFKVLSVAVKADGSYENDIWRSGGGHSALFYNGKTVGEPGYSHNANGGVRGCDSVDWHPVYDPGYLLNADGTVSACGGGSGTGFKWQCEQDGNYRDPNQEEDFNNDGSFWGCTETCSSGGGGQCGSSGPDGGSLKYVLNGDVGTCISQDSYPRPWGSGYCFPNNNSPWTVNANTSGKRVTLDSTRNMRRVFAVAGPTASKIKVLNVCTARVNDDGGVGGDNCDWWGVENPSLSPNRGETEKNFNQGANKNYFFSDWAYSTSNEGTYVYDVCVQGAGVTISGNVFVDMDGDGQKDSGEGNYGGARVFINQTLYTADSSGNYIAESLQTGQNYTVDLDVPATYRVTTGNDPTTFNNLNSDQTVNFGITPLADAWFQTKDADLFSSGSLVSRIPVQCQVDTGCDEYLSLVGDGGFPGVPIYNSVTAPNFGYGSVSSLGWLANSATSISTQNYGYFAAKMPSGAYEITDGAITSSGFFSSNGTADIRGYKWFKREGDLTLDANVNLNNGKVVLFVNGNATIKQKITINGGGKASGFFALIASGNINIDPGLTYQSQPAPKNGSKPALEGIFLANGQVKTGTSNPSNDSQLYVRGVLAGLSSVTLERDLDRARTSAGNNVTPSEFVEYAPDIILNLPPELMRDNPVWEEVAP